MAFLCFQFTMTNPLQKNINKFDWLWQPPFFIWWDQLIPDEAWVEHIVQCGHLGIPVTNSDFNKSFWHSEIYKNIVSFEEKIEFGIHYHNKYVNHQKVSFIMFQKIKMIYPWVPLTEKSGPNTMLKIILFMSIWKRAYEPLQHIQVVMLVPPDNGEAISPSHAKLHDKACQKSGFFWKDKKWKAILQIGCERLAEWMNG